MDSTKIPWWKDAIVYQVYPASFRDSNGDGLGDVPGVISKLDYIQSIGVDIVWLSPMYKSPQKDMGYDISDYESVHPPYGTVADVETLIKECHSRGMRLILDLVINHTSDQHAWFRESRSSQDNPKRDWYIWRPARYSEDGTKMPPTNWLSCFGGSVWEWDDTTQEYYLHLFAKEQPDLNWENPITRQAIYKSAMEFWLQKGVDGFRIDTVNMYSKGTDLPDAPIIDPDVYEQDASSIYCNGPRIHEFLREMHSQVLSKYDAVTVGEAQRTPDPARVLKYISPRDPQLSMVFQFDAMDLGQGEMYKFDGKRSWNLADLKKIMEKWQTFIAGTDAWTTAFCENHDNGRSVSRFASDAPKWREQSARMLAMMMASLTGTLFIYQGQEIGMINAPKDWPIEEYRDIESINFYKEMERRKAEMLPQVMRSIQDIGRDHARLPMQWDDSSYAGFTTRKEGAWMRVHDEYKDINVQKQEADPDSVLNFWRKMLQLRKKHGDIFTHGSFRLWDAENQKTFIFSKMRQASGEKQRMMALVVLNFTAEKQNFEIPPIMTELGWVAYDFALLISSLGGEQSNRVEGMLEPYEGRVYLLW